MITLIDYKAGNLTSVRKAFTHLGQESEVTEDPARVRGAQALVLPGVGHFVTTERLASSGVRAPWGGAFGGGFPSLVIGGGMQGHFGAPPEAREPRGGALLEGVCE